MSDWRAQPERGSKALTRFIAWLSLTMGRPAGRFLLYPISFYFLLTGKAARRASRGYLQRVLGRPAGHGQVFWHILTFSQVILDRVFFLKGRLDLFEVSVHGQEVIDAQLDKGEGCLLLGCHLGSFEVLRAMGTFDRQLPLKILMYPQNSQQILSILTALNPDLARQVIPLGTRQTMMLAKDHVDDGGLVGLLGDRTVTGDKTMRTKMLGAEAALPIGPFMLASALKIPIIFFCGLYMGGNRYEVHFQSFADQVVLDRKSRDQDLQIWIDRYADMMEHFCRRAPYNWFNFYDFWGRDDRQS